MQNNNNRSIAIIGDSLTDGRGSTHNCNRRWLDNLANYINKNEFLKNISVLNFGIGGNRVLKDGLGPCVLSRVDREVFEQNNIKWLIVFEGVNDIGTATTDEQQGVVGDLILAYKKIIKRAHLKGIKVFGNNHTISVQIIVRKGKKKSRNKINDWIRSSHEFDAVLDMDRAIQIKKIL